MTSKKTQAEGRTSSEIRLVARRKSWEDGVEMEEPISYLPLIPPPPKVRYDIYIGSSRSRGGGHSFTNRPSYSIRNLSPVHVP